MSAKILRFKRGRRPAVHTLRTMRGALALDKALASLGAPPAVCTDYVSTAITALTSISVAPGGGGGPWGMYLNGPGQDVPPGVPAEGLGDCTIADSCHHLMLTSANGGQIVVPTNAQALTAYEAVSGYQLGNEATDSGADETTVCDYMMSTGIAGVKSAGTGMLDPTNIDRIKWSIQIFGCARLGIIADEQMEDEFSSLEPWTTAADPNDPDAAGHDVPAFFYDQNFLYVVTWGGGGWAKGLQPVAWSLVANQAWLEECHAEVFADFVAAGATAPSGFDLAGLLAELPQVEQAA